MKPLAALALLPFLAACEAVPTDSAALAFACLARGVNDPDIDEEETARFNALAAAADPALQPAVAGDWSFRSAPPDPAVMDAAGSADLSLRPDGSLSFASRFCTPSGCDGGTDPGRWVAVSDPEGTRVLVQRGLPQGLCSQFLYDPSRPDTLQDPRAEATWTRG
jgi:hypothetical protein